jgi:hypothetical protein
VSPRPPPPPVAPRPPSRPKPAADKSACPAGATGSQLVQCAANFFEHSEHTKVVRVLRPAIERGLIRQKADLTEALRIYGISLYLTGLKAAARLVFGRLVEMEPTLKLDPRLVPPEVVQAFERIRRQKLARMLRRRLGKKKKRYGILNLLPPAGQFQNGHHVKAWIVLGLEVAFLTCNLVSYFYLRSSKLRGNGSYVIQDIDGNIIEDHRNEAKALLGLNYASFGLLMATLVYGIVDGWVYMTRLERQEYRRRRFLKRQLRISAIGGPTAAGVSVALRF